MKCFICQRRDAVPESDGGLLCAECGKPKHRHERVEFKFSPNAKVAYYSCADEACDWQAGPIDLTR